MFLSRYVTVQKKTADCVLEDSNLFTVPPKKRDYVIA